MKILNLTLLMLSLTFLISCGSQDETNEQGSGTYICPMECEGEKEYPETGKCPVCEMDLVKK